MTIAICDDEPLFRSIVYQALEKYKSEHTLSFQIVEFKSGAELLNFREDIFLVFLDYEMPERNGMDTARLLKQKNKDILIAFLTSHPEKMQNAFEVKAFRYILKPLKHHDLENCMNAALAELNQSKVILSDQGIQKIVSLKEIHYIEAGDNYTYVRTDSTVYHSKYTMSEWEAIVKDEGLVRCHKAYIVNLKYVDEIYTDYIVLYSKEKVLLSRRSRKDFQQKLVNYIKNNAK